MGKNQICQSCGMPMHTIGDFGTNEDGSKNEEYCYYCYEKGKFTDEGITKEAKMKNVAEVLQTKMFVSEEKAKRLTEQLFSNLTRWS